MKKKVVIFTGKKSQFQNSGVGKYILNYIPYLEREYDVEIFYQPESHNVITGNLWRLFKLPRIIKNDYKGYIKIMSDESLLISVRKKYLDDTIVIIHHYPFDTKVSNFKEHIIRWCSFITFNTILKKVQNIIVVSNKTKSVLDKLGIDVKNITVIPNSIDLSSYKILGDKVRKNMRSNFSIKYNIPNDKKRLLYVGSNESRKNLLVLFKTLNILSNEYILVRVGKDVSADELEKMNRIVSKSKLACRYYHLQDLSEEDLILIYQVSDVYLMPSLYEGFGRPIIEAQACGCPVISTKCGALEEVCGEGALFIENPTNEKEYAEKIDVALKERNQYIEKGKINVMLYTSDFNIEKFKRIIGRLV